MHIYSKVQRQESASGLRMDETVFQAKFTAQSMKIFQFYWFVQGQKGNAEQKKKNATRRKGQPHGGNGLICFWAESLMSHNKTPQSAAC